MRKNQSLCSDGLIGLSHRSHDNSKFVSCGGDRSVFLWDVMTGNTIRRIAGHMGRINVVEFNDDASVVVSGSYDSTVRIWDIR